MHACVCVMQEHDVWLNICFDTPDIIKHTHTSGHSLDSLLSGDRVSFKSYKEIELFHNPSPYITQRILSQVKKKKGWQFARF